MKRTLKTLKAQGLLGTVVINNLMDDIQDVLTDLPLTANRNDIEKYLIDKTIQNEATKDN